MKDTLAVVVGRFQVPKLHAGHEALLRYVAARHRRVLVVIAEPATLPTPRNPLPVSVREGMLQAWWRENLKSALSVAHLRDVGEPGLWSARLDRLIAAHLSDGEEAICYGSRESFISVYRGRFPTVSVPEANAPSGTQVREDIAQALASAASLSPAFRAGMIASVQLRPALVYPTVDVAVHRGEELLLARKARDQGAWRLPGGFVAAEDASFEEAAARELFEETGVVADNLRFLGSFRIDDWRYRDEQDSIITTLFLAEYRSGTPVAGDDVDDVLFFSLRDLPAIASEHHALLAAVKKALA